MHRRFAASRTLLVVFVFVLLACSATGALAEQINITFTAQERPSIPGRTSVDLFLGVQNSGGQVDGEFHCALLTPNGRLYSFLGCVQEGLASFLFSIPAGFRLDGYGLGSFHLPCSCPPITARGQYWVYAVFTGVGSPVAVSNVASCSFAVESRYNGAWRSIGQDHWASRCAANASYIVEPNYGEGGCGFTLYDYESGQRIRSYSSVDGVSTNMVRAAAFDAGGKLWLATNVGITQWDGEEFQNTGFPGVVPIWGYNDIDVDWDGDVWAASQFGLLRLHDGLWTLIDQVEGTRLGSVWCIDVSEALQSVYFGTSTTAVVGFYRDGAYTLLPSENGPNGVSDLAVAQDGAVWAAASALYRFSDQTWESWKWVGTYNLTYASGLTVDDDGVLWIGAEFMSSGNPTLLKFDGESYTDVSTEANVVDTSVESVTQTAAGDILVGSADGVRLLRSGAWRTMTGPQLKDEMVAEIDAIGPDVYVCTNLGLDSFRGGAYNHWYSLDRFLNKRGCSVRGVCSDGSANLWVTAGGSGVCRYDGSEWTQFSSSNSALTSNQTDWIKRDLGNNIWVRLYDYIRPEKSGLAVYDGSTWRVYQVDDGLPSNSTVWLTFDAENTPWCGTTDAGAARLDGDTWTVFNAENSGLPDNRVTGVAVDGSDCVWFQTLGGLAIYDGQAWATVSSLEQAVQERYQQVVSGPFYKTDLWIVAPNGSVWLFGAYIRVFDGLMWQNINPSDVPATGTLPGVRAAAFDASGNLWLGSSKPGGVRILDTGVKKHSTIALSSNKSSYVEGDQLELSLSLTVQASAIRQFYCGVIVPSGTIYYYPAWSTAPFGFGVALPSGFQVSALPILTANLPSSAPPVLEDGTYTFAAGLAEPGSFAFPDGLETLTFDFR